MSSKIKYNALSAAATIATSCSLNTAITNITTPAEKRWKKRPDVGGTEWGAHKQEGNLYFFFSLTK